MNTISDNLFGLILAGGRSKRMGQDKSLLVYHSKTQLEHAIDLLTPFCAKVFVSTRIDQGSQEGYKHLSQLNDLPQFSEMGPLGGILSAMTVYPEKSWVILASDLPYVTTETIRCLIDGRSRENFATAFISAHDDLPEPLCSIWEGKSRGDILALVNEGIKCPRKVLMESNTKLIIQKDLTWLENVNSPDEFKQAKGRILH